MSGARAFLFSLLSALVMGGVAFVSSDHIILSAIVAFLFFLAVFFLFLPLIARYKRRERIRHECYQFVNSFLITLSVCQSVEHAYEVGRRDIGGEFLEWNKKSSHMQIVERIEYLERYFQMEVYAMFVSILRLYLDMGGDVLALSSELLNELARIEETGRYLASKSIKNAVQFGFMWSIALVVIIFVRFGLNTFFASLKNSPLFLVGIGAFFGFILIALFIYLNAYVGEIQKEKKHG